jgi:hypothetical protein
VWNSTHVRNGQRRNLLHHETQLFPSWPITFLRPLPNASAGREKKVEIRPIVDQGPFSSSAVSNRCVMGADEWRAGKSGPGALGSLSKGPTGSTSYELLSTDYDDCCDAGSGR